MHSISPLPASMIHLRVLGSLDLRASDGSEIRSLLAQPKRFALLAYLAASPARFHRRDSLLALFWPESDQESARASLRTALSLLRRSLGDGAILGRGSEEVGVNPERLWCDVAAFDQAFDGGELERALECYRGDLLDGFHVDDAPEFGRWLDARRVGLRLRATEAAGRLAEREERAGRVEVAMKWARHAAALSPDDETSLRRLVTLFDAIGDRAGALRAYGAFAERLRTELDAEPAPETQALVLAIRAREGSLAAHTMAARDGTFAADPATGSEPVPEEAPREAPAAGFADPSSGGSVASGAGARRWNSRNRAIAGVSVALMALLAAGFYFPGRQASGTASDLPTSMADEAMSSVAVLPFADISAGRDQEYFADGMAEEIINALVQVHGLRVVARTSAFSYKGVNTDIREIGRQLGAETVLEGSVRRDGERLRITAQLIDTRTGYHLWSEAYDREAADIFAVQDEISRAITRTLTGRFVGAGGAAPGSWSTRDTEAYDHYLRGLHFLKRGTQEDLKRAVAQFEAAITRDPRYAAAYAALADAYSQYPTLGLLPPREAFALARPAAQRAVALDESLAEAHNALGKIQYEGDWDFAAAGRSYRRAVQLNPHFALYHRYPAYLVAMGQLAEAIEVTRTEITRDPISPWANSRLALWLYFDHQHDRAIELLHRIIELEPGYFYARWYLGLAYIQKRMFDEAIAEIQTALELSGGSPLVRATLGCAYARAGRLEEARKIRDELVRPGSELYLRPQGLVFLHSDLGETDEAFRWLEASIADRSMLPYVLTNEPLLDPLRSDPRFARLLTRSGLR
jgi:TolB-like protein/DNA-binding SARP family transcriptional activator/Tfp pilus assembly protein PilF